MTHNLENLTQSHGRTQQTIIDLKNELASFKVKNRAEHASFESNINLLNNENKKIKDILYDIQQDRDAMALVVENFEERVDKVQPKKSLFNRIFNK